MNLSRICFVLAGMILLPPHCEAFDYLVAMKNHFQHQNAIHYPLKMANGFGVALASNLLNMFSEFH